MRRERIIATMRIVLALFVLALLVYAGSWFVYFQSMEKAQQAVNAQDYQRAASEFQNAMRTGSLFSAVDFRQSAAMYGLGCTYVVAQELDKAEPLFLELDRRCSGEAAPAFPNHVDVLNGLAGVYINQYRPDKAAPVLERAVAQLRAGQQPKSEQAAAIINLWGKTYRDQGLCQQAVPIFKEALVLREQVCGKESEPVMSSWHDIGHCYYLAGNWEGARHAFQIAATLAAKLKGPNSELAVKMRNDLASVLIEQDETKQAKTILMSSLAVDNTAFDNASLSFCIGRLGYIFDRQNKVDRATTLYERARSINEQMGQTDDPGYKRAMDAFAAMKERTTTR